MKTLESLVERHVEKRIERTAEQLVNIISGADMNQRNVFPIGRKPFGIQNGDYVDAVQTRVLANLGENAAVIYNPDETLGACTVPDPADDFGGRLAKTELSIVFDPATQK